MRIVIDKDYPQIRLLQESYEKKLPTFKVKAVNESDKFVYARDLVSIDEATKAALDLAWDKAFQDCEGEIVMVAEGKEHTIWSSAGKVVVAEGVFGDFISKLGDVFKKALGGLSKGWGKVKDGIKKMGNDAL